MLLMSGGAPAVVAVATGSVSGGVTPPGDCLLSMRSRTASNPASARPAIIHGVRSRLPALSGAPAGAPQREQNCEPAASGAVHATQAAPDRGVPHCAQKFPTPVV